jgi:hypothetical protein
MREMKDVDGSDAGLTRRDFLVAGAACAVKAVARVVRSQQSEIHTG